ncbi:MAG: hypothetical protein NVS9B4_18740 [Candidatus Acidiferrum sp.]
MRRTLNKSVSIFLLLSMVALALLPSGSARAQESRGSIVGRVTDPSGAAIPGTEVTVTNTQTNIAIKTITEATGEYTVLYLIPGQYSLSVQASGFKNLVRQGIDVRVGDRLTVDLQLEFGTTTETVTVTAEAPLLETANGSGGQVIDQRRISELPLSDGNPFVLARLAPGIAYTGDLKFSRPFDNFGTSAIRVNGSPGGNEFSLDGFPNMTTSRRVAFVPPSDAVQEFKVQTTSFDAEYGHTAGADVNVTLKSGANALHGSAYEFVRNDKLSANDFFLNRAGKPRAPVRYNRYGGSVGGPVWLPKIYNGHDRTFFFFAYEALPDVFPEPGQFTVPTEAERNGDFSALLSQGITIYDPATAVKITSGPNAGRIQRSPLKCGTQMNVICADRLSAIAKNYLAFYPHSNQPGDSLGRNNFISANPRSDRFNAEVLRLDHNLSSKQKFFFHFIRNWRRELRNNWSGVTNGVMATGGFLFRINDGFGYDHVYTFSPTTLLDARLGFSSFVEAGQRPSAGAFDPATLGFSSQTTPLFKGSRYLPAFGIGGFDGLGGDLGSFNRFMIYSLQPTLTKILNRHTLRIGYDFRSYREDASSPGNAAGQYIFGTAFTRGPFDNSPSATIGQDLASFMLGLPTGGGIDRNASRANQTLYHGLFFQDDWRVSPKLTLNMGIRFDYEGATTERYDRNIRGFDTTSPSPIEAAARAAYAANPIPEVSPSNFRVRGGLLFADSTRRGFWMPEKNNFQPRIGFAYRLGKQNVVRGGWGISSIPFIVDAINQSGFSQSTQIVPSLDNGLTFRANLFNPFPDGVAEPPGSSLGLGTSIGRGLNFTPVDRHVGLVQHWALSLQRELGGRWLVEGTYVGTRGDRLTTFNGAIDALPRQFLSTSPIRDDATNNFLTALVSNPFKGLAPGTGLNGSTVQRAQLLLPYPQFTGIGAQRYDGSSIYHSGQLRVEKRFSRGYTLLASYTWSKLIEKVSFLNATDTDYEKRISGDDVSHRIVVSGIWELPFGRGRKWGSDLPAAVNHALGGWQFEGIFQAQTGFPLGLGNVAYFGDPSQLRANINGKTVDNTFDQSGFYVGGIVNIKDPRIRLVNNIRTLPSVLPGFRGQGLNLWDLSIIKKFSITERVKLQFRSEFLNAFNHPQFNGPNLDTTSSSFGKVTSQNNLPRNIQLGLKLTF